MIADNATLSVPKRLGRGGFLSRSRRDRLAPGMIENLAIKTLGPDLPVSALSGGKQQKVVAREVDLRLARHADVVVGALGLAGTYPGQTRVGAGEVADALAEVEALIAGGSAHVRR